MIRTTRAGLSPAVLTVLTVVAASAPSPAAAGVTKYLVNTSGGFYQSGPNDVAFFGGIGGVEIVGEGKGQLMYAEVGLPNGGLLFTGPPHEYEDDTDPNLTLFSAGALETGPDLATPELLGERFGPGRYEFLFRGGALDGLSDSMTAGTGFLYANQSPRLLPSSYALLAGGGDRGRDLLVEWSGFSIADWATWTGKLSVLDSFGEPAAEFAVDITSGRFLLPGGTLKNGGIYYLSLDYTYDTEGLSANGANTAVHNHVGVFVDLNPAAAVPEPATLAAAALGLAVLPLAPRRAKRR